MDNLHQNIHKSSYIRIYHNIVNIPSQSNSTYLNSIIQNVATFLSFAITSSDSIIFRLLEVTVMEDVFVLLLTSVVSVSNIANTHSAIGNQDTSVIAEQRSTINNYVNFKTFCKQRNCKISENLYLLLYCHPLPSRFSWYFAAIISQRLPVKHPIVRPLGV